MRLKVFIRDYLRRFLVLRKSLGKLKSNYSQFILKSFDVNIQSLFIAYICHLFTLTWTVNYSKPFTFYAKHCLRITGRVRKIIVRFLICRNRGLKLYQLIVCDNSSIFTHNYDEPWVPIFSTKLIVSIYWFQCNSYFHFYDNFIVLIMNFQFYKKRCRGNIKQI